MIKVGGDPVALNNAEQDPLDLCEMDNIKNVLEFFDIGLMRLVASAEAGKCRALVNSGCKIDVKNDEGQAMMEVAKEVNSDFIIQLLNEHKNTNALFHAALAGNSKKVQKLCAAGDLDLNFKDWSYTRPSDGKRCHRPLLAETVSLGWYECARLMVKHGADVNYEIEVCNRTMGETL